MNCIFCKSTGPSNTISHIIPESLGGLKSPVGKPGVTCDSCNHYFGQKVESKALSSFPFIILRILSGTPTKKKNMPSMTSSAGTIHASGIPLIIELDPRSDDLKEHLQTQESGQLRILAEVTEPLAVARMFLKMGLELLGKHYYEIAVSTRLDAAREFSRKPRRGKSWWFIIQSTPNEHFENQSLNDDISIEITEKNGVLFSIIRLIGLKAIIPLEEHVILDPKFPLPEPEYRVIHALC